MSKTPVSTLQEYMAKKALPIPIYEITNERNGTHLPSFTYKVRCGIDFATGTASNKKEAKHIAAREFLKKLGESSCTNPASSINAISPIKNTQTICSYYEPGSDGSEIFVNSVGKLCEHCTKFNLKSPSYEQRNSYGPAHKRMFTMICAVGAVSTEATASTKKQAKHDAAQNMLQKLIKVLPSEHGLYKSKRLNDCEQEIERKLRDSLNLLDLKIEQPKIPVAESIELAKQLFPKLREKNSIKVASNLEVKEYHRTLKESLEPAIREKIHRELGTISSCTKQEVLDRVSKLFHTKMEFVILATTAHGSAVCCKLDSFPTLADIGIGATMGEAREKAITNLLKTIDKLLM